MTDCVLRIDEFWHVKPRKSCGIIIESFKFQAGKEIIKRLISIWLELTILLQ